MPLLKLWAFLAWISIDFEYLYDAIPWSVGYYASFSKNVFNNMINNDCYGLSHIKYKSFSFLFLFGELVEHF